MPPRSRGNLSSVRPSRWRGRRPLEEVEAMRNRGVRKIVGLATVILLCLFGLIGGGLSGGLVMLGLSALLLLVFAAVAGRAGWAFVVSRRIGGAVAAAGVVALVVGCATIPPTATTFSSSTSSASASGSSTSSASTSGSSAAPSSSWSATSRAATSRAATSSAPSSSTPNEGAVRGAESSLAQVESGETTSTGTSDITGLLSDQAADAAVDGASPTS